MGCTAADFLRHHREITNAVRAKERAQQAVRAAAGQVKRARAAARAAGVDLAAYGLAEELTALSLERSQDRLRNLSSYLAWSGLPIGTQVDLFETPEGPSALEAHEHNVWLAITEGEDAALLGRARTDNPHPVGSEMHVGWDHGWLHYPHPEESVAAAPEGEAEAATQGAPPPQRRGPGRPRGARNKPKGGAVAERLRRAEHVH